MTTASAFGISFVIPCHDGGALVAEAVDSLLRQPLSFPFEVIVVDDGSGELLTLAAIDTVTADPRVRVHRLRTRQGVQVARTAGLKAARYGYVMPLDCDDLLATDPELLAGGSYPERAVRILAGDPAVAFVHTYSQMFGDFEGLTISAYPCTEQLVVRKHHAPMPLIYRTADALAAGGYDSRIRKWQDWAFAISLLAARHRRGCGTEIRCIAGPFHRYRIHRRFQRISATSVSELEVVRLVVDRHLDYFQTVLGDPRPADELAATVYAHKPDRLTDLLHMAAADLDQALTLAHQRRATLASPADRLGIP
ncbi:glycosyltransferase family 2 protein [Nocardia goodfellowii]|uniref:Glycosyltransferase involved in cell wall biosynthesis n=1 Tax=Nocardia goodfellowii TaxID=882446 RepID=A0ABS4QK94_9NOCA|nr:glycosyltransferase family 2 protein [Nocardia goodfellowii]MBP2191498.1 glycosyltransferase involved in cell wall biosynthesis [Nocardia goodfellowii]